MRKKRVLILGSTGSVGTQTLSVIEEFSDRFEVAGLAAGSNAPLLLEQIGRFSPSSAALASPPEGFVPKRNMRWHLGERALLDICSEPSIDLAVVAVVGIAGMQAVLRLIERGIPVLLANKETLVAGGKLVMERARVKKVPIIPVDSEHSAIFQCLQGAGNNPVKSLVLTASGGPFRTLSLEQMKDVTLGDALKHPNWSMGKKITIDSATMMNKALEIIEAHVLFSVPADKIQVVVHPESIVHSAVEFMDGSVIAQMGVPDMRVPIAYALSYPQRLPLPYKGLDLTGLAGLHFERPDFERFPALKLAYLAISMGGVMGAVLNGANEAAVQRFMDGEIKFLQIAQLVDMAMREIPNRPQSFENILRADREARELVKAYAF